MMAGNYCDSFTLKRRGRQLHAIKHWQVEQSRSHFYPLFFFFSKSKNLVSPCYK